MCHKYLILILPVGLSLVLMQELRLVLVFKGRGGVIMVHLPLQIPIVFYLHQMQLKVYWNQLLMLMKKKARTQKKNIKFF
eukprot:6772854-Ditylum_brightwellii.AAC.1